MDERLTKPRSRINMLHAQTQKTSAQKRRFGEENIYSHYVFSHASFFVDVCHLIFSRATNQTVIPTPIPVTN